MKRNKKKAISLIVLVITILVLSILAATVIISLSNTNIMGQASETVFKSDMASYKEAYEMYVINKLATDASFDRNTLDVTYQKDATEFKAIFGENVPAKYQKGLKVVKGKLVYATGSETEQAVVKALGMEDTISTVPIPSGFYYVGGERDTGLVISDEESDENQGVDADLVGNQFVWIPVEDIDLFKSGSGLTDWDEVR